MGLDMEYQAIPDNCVLLQRSLKDPEFGELLQFLPGFLKGEMAHRDDGIDREFGELARDMAKQYPGLEKRHTYEIGRRWDVLHYLLSANRREEPATEKDALLDTAVHGHKVGDLQCVQGSPIGYVSSAEVRQIASLLKPLTSEDLRVRYVSEKMEALAVYKIFADQAEDGWKFSAEAFEHFRAFYLETAAAQLGVLVILH